MLAIALDYLFCYSPAEAQGGAVVPNNELDLSRMGRCGEFYNDLHINTIITMMTSSNENIFRVTGPMCGEFTGRRRIPLTKASDAELLCFLWSVPEKTVE